jgi:3-hydroxyacyl-[acyl-carrier-protein] dehydratase
MADILNRLDFRPYARPRRQRPMHFTFVDRVVEFQRGVSITTLKALSLGEEYLLDHFPRFPVMPGVLMLQAMTEAGTVLIGASDDFAHSIVTLKEAKNVRFADFVQPGNVLTVSAEIIKAEPRDVELKTRGTIEGRVAVSARLVLERYNLADSRPELAPTDAYLRLHRKQQFALVFPSGDREASAANGAPHGSSLASTPNKD